MRNKIRGKSLFALIIFFCSIFMSEQELRADAIYGDITGTRLYSGYGLSSGFGTNDSIVEGFTMTGTYNLTSVSVYLSQYVSNPGSNLALSIYSDNGSNNPGTDLYDLTTNLTGSTTGDPTLATFSGSGSFTLVSGTKYWLNMYATNPSATNGSQILWVGVLTQTFDYASPSGVGATQIGFLRTVGANPATGTPVTDVLRPAFELNGTPTTAAVPEPSTFVLTLVGSALVLGIRRRVR